jgi:hypothetical protein
MPVSAQCSDSFGVVIETKNTNFSFSAWIPCSDANNRNGCQTVADIVTLTINPAIDLFVNVDRVVPERKLRCSAPKRDPGGGGINVARVAHRLGSNVSAIYPVGGALGK